MNAFDPYRGTGAPPVRFGRTGAAPVPRFCAFLTGLLVLAIYPVRGEGDQQLMALNTERYDCWQMLPVADENLPQFRQRLDRFRRDVPNDSWVGIFSLYLAQRSHDTSGMLGASGTAAPEAFPPAAMQPAWFDQRTAAGQSPAQAGLELLTTRSYAPLRALRELDAGLTSEADALRRSGRAADADTMLACRDRLRQGYLAASRNVIDRLFALNLLGRAAEARALTQQASRLKYLTDPQDLAVLLARLGPAEAWQRLVQPLLADEVAFVGHPPEFQTIRTAGSVEMTVTAGAKSQQGRATSYSGGVTVAAAALHIACDRLAIDFAPDGSPALLTADGHVLVRGAPGAQTVSARGGTYDPATGVFTFDGDVRITKGEQTTTFRACTLSARGGVTNMR